MNEVVQRYLVGTGKGPVSDDFFFAIGFAHCANPGRYVRQLAEDWSHKTGADPEAALLENGAAVFYFSGSEDAVLTPKRGGIGIGLRTADRERNEHWRGVIELDLDRLAFRFRQAPLKYEWTDHT